MWRRDPAVRANTVRPAWGLGGPLARGGGGAILARSRLTRCSEVLPSGPGAGRSGLGFTRPLSALVLEAPGFRA